MKHKSFFSRKSKGPVAKQAALFALTLVGSFAYSLYALRSKAKEQKRELKTQERQAKSLWEGEGGAPHPTAL
ncbi:MAG: hypothetical protein H7Y02_05590 [Candidatus Obscuribacterales bacterium]|nr:hypothetical protein [Steroidobacteraceae bacterium]